MIDSKIEGRKVGSLKTAAKRLGLSLPEYLERRNNGLKSCFLCRNWLPLALFNAEKSRTDGLHPKCKECQSKFSKSRYVSADVRGRKPMGPTPKPSIDGDKLQARHKVNLSIKKGLIKNPNDIPCAKCGHIGTDSRHEYHHYQGYSAVHHLSVISLCVRCHRHEDKAWTKRKRNHKGQFYGREN